MRNTLNSDDPNVRLRASAALAWHGVDDGIQELVKLVKERTEEKTEHIRKFAPIWVAAIPFLGIAGDKKSVSVLAEVLSDENATLDAIIGAVIALERISDESAIPALHKLLEREDLPTERVLNSSMGSVEDARWQVELNVASALSKLGAPSEEVRQIIKPYLDDPRAYVRRYANRILNPARGEQ